MCNTWVVEHFLGAERMEQLSIRTVAPGAGTTAGPTCEGGGGRVTGGDPAVSDCICKYLLLNSLYVIYCL